MMQITSPGPMLNDDERVIVVSEQNDFANSIRREDHMATHVISKFASKPKPSVVPATRYVFFFADGKAEGNQHMRAELGGKGAGLAEMTNAGLPVPPGFTIQTAACREYMRTGKVSDLLERQMTAALA